jgi:hypothetical protein
LIGSDGIVPEDIGRGFAEILSSLHGVSTMALTMIESRCGPAVVAMMME